MPAYLEMEQELSRLARRAAGMRGGPRLLILPGIMGSSIGRLRKNGGADVTWFDPVEIAQGQLLKLALPGGNRYWAVGVLRFAYERLRLVLRIAGFDAVFHPYDWRRDTLWNGRELADRLLRERRQDVVIVGHSQGGLVARAALAHKGGERIARVIQLGAPNKGTFVSIQALRGTYPLIRRVAMLDLKHSAEDLARELIVTFPGLCELLPAASLCKDFDPFDPGQWPEGPKPESGLLDAAHDAIKRLPPPDERFRLIAGFGQDTVLGLRRSGRKLSFGRGPAGDGTVPLALAQWPGLPTWYAEESHGSLPGNADVGRAVADLARAGTTTALPQVLPRHRGVPTLWQEDLRAPPEPKIAWGDLSEREQREFLHEFVGVTLPSTAAAAPKRDAAAKPVELSFMEGSITQSKAAAVVLGAFANVEPAGAAQDIDRMLNGAISDLARRRAISSAAGEVFVLPVGRSGLVPQLVVFAGLGHFARYGPDVQRLAAANVTRTLALAGIENFAMVLWGTTSGTGPADAARAQLEGVLTALADLEPDQRVKRITIVSRDAKRIAEARSVAEDLLRLHPAAPLLKLARERKPARKAARPPKPVATPLAWLFVQESAATLRVALLGPAPKATALVASRRLDHRLLEREHSRLVPGMSTGDLAEFGERLAALLLPPEIAEALPSVKSAPIVVVHDTRERALALGSAVVRGLGAGRCHGPLAPLCRGRNVGRQVARAAPPREGIQRAARRQPDRRPARRRRGRRARGRDAHAGRGRRHHGDPRRRRDARAPARRVPLGRLRRHPLCRARLVRPRGAGVERHPLRRRPRALRRGPRRDGLRARARLLQRLRVRPPARDGEPAAAARPQRRLRGSVPARRRRELHRHLVAGGGRSGCRVCRRALPRPGPGRVDRRRAQRGARRGA